MSLNNVIFIDNLPKLDLHGLDRDSARMYIEDFIRDNIIMKNEIVVIVHGIGGGVLKEVTHSCLAKNKNVVDFKIFYYNQGCTIVQLKIWQLLHFVILYASQMKKEAKSLIKTRLKRV